MVTPVQLKPLPPEEALRYFRSKGYRTGFAWQDVWQQEHARAFTVAKAMRLDILGDIREALDKALAEGIPFEQFKKSLRPTLEAKGWWGRKEMVDPATGETADVQLGSPRRLRIIYDTNIRMAHAAGDWAKIERVKDRRPYLLYSAVRDRRTRPLHKTWDGTVLLVDDPWWDTHYPPNGWRCRCRPRQLGPRDLDRYGLKLGQAPVIDTKPWKNPRTGEIIHVPEGIDPGFGYNVGKEHMRSLVPPPSSGPLSAHAINPPADTPMPPPRAADPQRLLPGIKSPGGLTEDGYVERFLAEFGATPSQPKLFLDKLDEPMVIGRRMFEQADGRLKVAKRDREKGLLLLADALKDPDEIWWQWEQNAKTGRWSLIKRYLTRFDMGGKSKPALLAFSVGEDGWDGVTAFTPDSVNNLMNQRKGVLAYRRPE